MHFYKRLGNAIREKVLDAYAGLSSEKRRGSCLPVAFDGLVRGALEPSVYREHLERGQPNGANQLPSIVITVEAAFNRSFFGRADYYTSSQSLSSDIGLGGRTGPLCREGAEEVVRRIRRGNGNFGVLVAVCGTTRREGHISSLISGGKGTIISVDGGKRCLTRCLSNREAVLILRQAQAKGRGLVIEVGRIRGEE